MLSNRRVRAGAMLLVTSVLVGCGGGGGDGGGGDGGGGGGGADPSSHAAAAPGVVPDDSSTPAVAAPNGSTARLTSFLANGEGSIATKDVRLDESGNVANTTTGA